MTDGDPADGRGRDAESLPAVHYEPPPPIDLPAAELVLAAGTPEERRFRFHDRLLIGRHVPGRAAPPGALQIEDPTVSGRHCSLSQDPDGRILVRDMSRNGTRLDGRRLVPNVESEITRGQTLRIADVLELRLEVDAARNVPVATSATVGTSTMAVVTVLVGDIRGYTALVQKVEPAILQRAVGRVFGRLERVIVEHGGTVKEYQGDAIFAFWEAHRDAEGNHARRACAAALALDGAARALAGDPEVWSVEGFPLRMDWALATGPVVLDSFGGERRAGLSMVGGPVVLAFRMEKFVSDRTGPILACPVTREKAADGFRFRKLGRRHAKGFEKAHALYALLAPR